MIRETEDAMDDLRKYYLGELDKKDAEIERLKKEWTNLYCVERKRFETIKEKDAEIERLRAFVARARENFGDTAAIRDALAGLEGK